jgi:hypothetical protein
MPQTMQGKLFPTLSHHLILMVDTFIVYLLKYLENEIFRQSSRFAFFQCSLYDLGPPLGLMYRQSIGLFEVAYLL